MMKINLASWLLGLILISSLFSCSKEDEEISTEVGIIGVWTVQSADITLDGKSLESYVEEYLNDLKVQMGENYSEEVGEAFAESFDELDVNSEFEGNTIEFKSENNMVIVTDEDGTNEGTWSANDKLVTITIEDNSQTFEVRSLTSNSAAFIMSFDDFNDIQTQSPVKVEVVMNVKK